MRATHPQLDVEVGVGEGWPRGCQILALHCQILLLSEA